MLPSKGYFSSIPCPFYDSGFCVRPHCHFRHSKKDRLEDPSTSQAKSTESVPTEDSSSVTRIKKIVTETVKQVLSQTDLTEKTDGGKIADDILKDVVSSIDPNLDSHKPSTDSADVPSYKPTPISELNKRHIPVVYAPTKPVSIDRVRKKEVKESQLYLPRSLSKHSTPQSTYVPSSTTSTQQRKNDCYVLPDTCSGYTYKPTQIPKIKNISTSLMNFNFFASQSGEGGASEETLKALDNLIEEEFGPSNEVTSSTPEKDEIIIKNNLPDKKDISDESSKSVTKTPVSMEQCQEIPPDSSVLPKNSVVQSNVSKTNNQKSDHSKSSEDHTSSIHTQEHVKTNQDTSHKHRSKEGSSKEMKSTIKESSSSSEHKERQKHKKCDEKHSKLSHSEDKHKHKHKRSKDKDVDHSKSKHDKKHNIKNSETDRKKRDTNHKNSETDRKKRDDSKELKHGHKHSRSSSHHSNKSHKSREKSHRERDHSVERYPPKKLKLEVAKEDIPIVDFNSSSSDVEEVVNEDEAIVIDSSSNSSFASNELAAVESWPLNEPDSPPPLKKKRDEDIKACLPAPQSVLCERWRRARETVLTKTPVPGKVKISHVPNVSSLLTAKDELIAKAKKAPETSSHSLAPAYEEYVPKAPTRKAHTPSEAILKYPVVIMEENLKVPISIRQPCLNNIYDEFRKFCEPEVASKRAQEEELEICRRLHVSKTYQNAVALALLRIRKNKGQQNTQENNQDKKNGQCLLYSHSVPDYTYGWSLYKCFAKYILTDEEYIANGYPIQISSRKDCAYIEKSARRASAKQPEDPSMRICAHCSKNYFVDEKGFPLEENNCSYHWGRLRRVRIGGGFTEIYICCGAEIGSEPCTSGRYHVSNLHDEDFLEGFVKTRPMKPGKSVEEAGIYAIDCEMCYTTKGFELARCTLVDLNGKTVYDKIAALDDPVLDYCTRFSGMTEEMMKGAKHKLKDIQRDLLKIVNEKTILVGHSLENDMKALKIFHRTLVDTSVVFPHQMGLPFKHALKRIAKDILNINIQDKESGHDSFEDANTCMQIMLWKIKEDAKGRKPRVIISLHPTKGTPSVTR